MDIDSFDQVRAILGAPHPATAKKIYSHLNPRMREFIRHSPLVFVSTVDEDGFPTLSPKGDHAGFVQSQDENHLLIPERKGNKLAFSFRNILGGSKIGLLFLVPGTPEVLRVQGTSQIISDDELNSQLASASQKALLINRVKVSSCYFHCGKALLRSNLWGADLSHVAMNISFGIEISENKGLEASQIGEFDEGVHHRYKNDL